MCVCVRARACAAVLGPPGENAAGGIGSCVGVNLYVPLVICHCGNFHKHFLQYSRLLKASNPRLYTFGNRSINLRESNILKPTFQEQ